MAAAATNKSEIHPDNEGNQRRKPVIRTEPDFEDCRLAQSFVRKVRELDGIGIGRWCYPEIGRGVLGWLGTVGGGSAH